MAVEDRNLAFEQEGKFQTGQKTPSKNAKKLHPDKSWRNQKSSDSHENPEAIRDRDDLFKRNKKNNRYRKNSTSQNSKEVGAAQNGGDQHRNRGEEDRLNWRRLDCRKNSEETRARNERDEPELVLDRSETHQNYHNPSGSRIHALERHHRKNDLYPANVRDEIHYSESSRNEFWNEGRKVNHHENSSSSQNHHDGNHDRNRYHHRENVQGKRNYSENFQDERRHRENVRDERHYGKNTRYQQRSELMNENYHKASTSREFVEENNNKYDRGNSEESDTNGPKPLDFCENPEITRARIQHHHQVKRERQSRNRNPGECKSY